MLLSAAESTIRAAEAVLGLMAVGTVAVLAWLLLAMLRSVTGRP